MGWSQRVYVCVYVDKIKVNSVVVASEEWPYAVCKKSVG